MDTTPSDTSLEDDGRPFVIESCGDSMWDEVLAQPAYDPTSVDSPVPSGKIPDALPLTRILSVNVGLPRFVDWGGRTVSTGIFKHPALGPVSLELLNFVGDRQADLTVHGGPDKAVYAYDTAHYAYWQTQIERADWTPGLFGENLTTTGLLESDVRIGDLFRVGSALLRAVQPRFPCYKLNIRFDDPGMTRRFARSGRSGIYFRVVEPGLVQAGDGIALLEAADTTITIQTVSQLILTRKADADLLAGVVALPHLPDSLKRQLSH